MNIRWKDLGIAFVLAIILWYGVSGSEKLETQVDVRLEYKGAPQGLVVREGLINKVEVRVRASAGLLRSLNKRTYSYSLDLSSITKGRNVLPIPTNELPFWGGIEVIDVTPAVIELYADSLEKKTLPISVILRGAPPKDVTVSAQLTPDYVEVSGPSELILPLGPINLTAATPSEFSEKPLEQKFPLPIADGVIASARETVLTLTMEADRAPVTVTRQVELLDPLINATVVEPKSVTLSLLVPASQEKLAAKNSAIKVVLETGKTTPGNHRLPVRVLLPQGFKLVSTEPAEVLVHVVAVTEENTSQPDSVQKTQGVTETAPPPKSSGKQK